MQYHYPLTVGQPPLFYDAELNSLIPSIKPLCPGIGHDLERSHVLFPCPVDQGRRWNRGYAPAVQLSIGDGLAVDLCHEAYDSSLCLLRQAPTQVTAYVLQRSLRVAVPMQAGGVGQASGTEKWLHSR